jgi:hypothetical protein
MALTTEEKRFAAYFVVGLGTEVDKANGPYVFTPAHTSSDRQGSVSVGVTQTDLGQHQALVKNLLAAYNAWAQANNKPPIENKKPEDKERAVAATNKVDKEKGEALNQFLSSAEGPSLLNQFLASADGRSLVDQWDNEQINRLISTGSVSKISDTTYFSALSNKDQFALIAAAYKVENARGSGASEKIIAFLNGYEITGKDVHEKGSKKINHTKINAGDSSAKIMAKLDQVIFTELFPVTYGPTVAKATLLCQKIRQQNCMRLFLPTLLLQRLAPIWQIHRTH